MNKYRRQSSNNSPIELRHASPKKVLSIITGFGLLGLATCGVIEKNSPDKPYCGVVFEVGPTAPGKQQAMLDEVKKIKEKNGITDPNFGTTDLNYRSYKTKPIGDTEDFTQSGDQGLMPLTEGECEQADNTVKIPWNLVDQKQRIADITNTAVE